MEAVVQAIASQAGMRVWSVVVGAQQFENNELNERK